MTSRFKASTYLDVYRDNAGPLASGSFEGYDDAAESSTPVARRVPAHMIQKTQTTYDPVSGRRTILQNWSCLLRPGADVIESDRIQDTFTLDWFIVDTRSQPPLVTGSVDVRLTLTRVTR